jgi:hypothetical protein
LNGSLNMLLGDTLDFIIGGRASASIDGTILLTTQIPEPSTLTLVGLAACGLAAKKWRRRAAA